MRVEVIEFNKNRNKFKLDTNLEINMLEEEIQEFFNATDTAERLDAYIDTKYVYIGTQAKTMYNGYTIDDTIRKWIDSSIKFMEDTLIEEVGFNNFKTIVKKAEKIVCNANALKGKKLDNNGKVVKDEAYKEAIDATQQIREMIKKHI